MALQERRLQRRSMVSIARRWAAQAGMSLTRSRSWTRTLRLTLALLLPRNSRGPQQRRGYCQCQAGAPDEDHRCVRALRSRVISTDVRLAQSSLLVRTTSAQQGEFHHADTVAAILQMT